MKIIIRIWAAIALASLLLFAFTGVGIWVQVDLSRISDHIRWFLLALFHTMWIPAIAQSE